jgi:hypothetical protein
MKKIKNKLKPFSLCKFNWINEIEKYKQIYPKEFLKGQFIFINEITNVPGHGIFIGVKSKKNYVGYHVDNFIPIDEKDV